MPATVVDAVKTPFPCPCNCHDRLSLDERGAGIDALYRFDDAMRGWGQTVIWDLAAPTLWRLQQQLGEVKWVAVRDTGCIHARLLGFCVHELIHATCGDPSLPNYGTPVGLPYGVPEDVPPGEEAAYLHPYNQNEARAWVGLAAVAFRLFGIEWTLLPAREVGTYGFAGGNALVDVPPGYRRVAHYDHDQHPRRYLALARALEDEAHGYFTAARLDDIAARFEAAEAIGRASRPVAFPSPREMARLRPKKPGRNDLCVCGSMRKWKQCCGALIAE
ncbi:MAG TPA: SEC-C metal-binding domain-containing protein [Kofleriaceae bacterium]|nr:SEC-C metal-binding domain-containing protein [Kofleriaceae bacterium]